MENDRTPNTDRRSDVVEPSDRDETLDATSATPDPNDEIPVPIAMFPSEIDERAQVVEALREEGNTNRADELGLQP